VYYLNKAGRELVGSQKVITKTPNYLHTVMKNDIYIHFGCPKMWANETPIQTSEFMLVPDSFFSVKGVQYFLEVDRLQKMNTNFTKLNKYKTLHDLGLWQKRNGGRFPIVVFYTTKETRKHQLEEKNPGLQLMTLTKKDLQIM
jgi:hypothetical protein